MAARCFCKSAPRALRIPLVVKPGDFDGVLGRVGADRFTFGVTRFTFGAGRETCGVGLVTEREGWLGREVTLGLVVCFGRVV